MYGAIKHHAKLNIIYLNLGNNRDYPIFPKIIAFLCLHSVPKFWGLGRGFPGNGDTIGLTKTYHASVGFTPFDLWVFTSGFTLDKLAGL